MSRTLAELKSSYDVVVVGGRCAGAATAMLLAQRGLDVLVVERAARGADTLSTLALMRAGVLQLARWGLLEAIQASDTAPIRKTTFHYAGEAVEIRIKPRDGIEALYAPRRTLLDPLLTDAAEAAGADVSFHVRLTDVVRNDRGRIRGVWLQDGHLDSRQILTNLLIGADGIQSTVAKLVDARPYRTGPHASSVIFTLARGLDVEGYHWHFAKAAAAGLIPTGGGEVLVFASAPRERFMTELRLDLEGSFFRILSDVVPWLGAAVRVLGHRCPFRGFAGHDGYFRPAWGPGWALVGDAGYFKDPLTAHGITDALRDAELLANAVAEGSERALAQYQAVRDHLSLPLFSITDEIASYGWTQARLQALHKSMSDEMVRETRYLAELDTVAVT